MSRNAPIARPEVEIDDAFGLRMRTAAEFICLAGRFQSDVWVIREGRRCNGRRMRDIPGGRFGLAIRFRHECE